MHLGLTAAQPRRRLALLLTLCAAAAACDPGRRESAPTALPPPSILLVTLDTTRADAVGPEAAAVETPSLDALAARGARFHQAYTTAPMTLPAHASMLTGLYPAEHGVHENARHLGPGHPLVAERLRAAGYMTAAFVSGLPLDRQFGLARGFDLYDDELAPGEAERRAGETTDRALAFLGGGARAPLFLWVHYFDPHEPYEPPEPFRSRYPESPYLGEIAYMDRELGRLVEAFEGRPGGGGSRILVAGDHGEGLGEHGETLHGNLLYQGVMRVPLIVAGDGIGPAEIRRPVSVRQVAETVLHWAGLEGGGGLLAGEPAPVLGEAMKPYLQYGWQPQVMAVSGPLKAIRAGGLEVYDVVADPAEAQDLAGRVRLEPAVARALSEYPLPRPAPDDPAEALSREARERLASLGYVGSGGRPALQPDAPSPRRMTALFADLDRGSALFVRQEYERAIPVFAGVLERDPGNLMVALRLAVAHSVSGDEGRALEYFARAQEIDAGSVDLAHYRAMHHLRAGDWEVAGPLFETVLARMPARLAALEGLAQVRERQGRLGAAAALLERAAALETAPVGTLLRLGELRMAMTDTPGAIRAFERARALAGEAFPGHLELGVCYLAARRFAEAAASLDRVPASHPGYPMALFKRAQVSVLLGEPDREERIRLAYRLADDTTRPLVENEPLFQGVALR